MSNLSEGHKQNERKTIPLPGYFANRPLYKAIRELRDVLGYQDACIELNEIAIRFTAEHASKYAAGIKGFVRDAAAKYKVPVGAEHLDDLKRSSAEGYIVQTYHVVENYLRQLTREYRQYRSIPDHQWPDRDNNGSQIDPLSAMAQNLEKGASKTIQKPPEFLLLQYYRLVRHALVHRRPDSEKAAAKAFLKISSSIDYYKRCYESLNAPNDPERLQFDDFMLYTRAVKYYSNVLNDACDLVPEHVAKELSVDARLVSRFDQKGSIEKKRKWAVKFFFALHGGQPDDGIRFYDAMVATTAKTPKGKR